MGSQNEAEHRKFSPHFVEYYQFGIRLEDIGFSFSEFWYIRLYYLYVMNRNSLAVLPKAPDGNYYYEDLVAISALTALMQATKEREISMDPSTYGDVTTG
jgi:hypothetical protein